MNKNSKIYIAGHKGLVGSAVLDHFIKEGFSNLITRTHSELNLMNQYETQNFFFNERPEYVVLAAAKVGGIHANSVYPADFIYNNLAIQTNVIHQSFLHQVKRLIFLGSSCIYPKECPQPIKEDYLLSGLLEPTNRPYALAKISGIEMCWSYNRQYKTKYLGLMPTNLYGDNDNYDLDNSHVIPALINKIHYAKVNNISTVTFWGSGRPRREFLFSKDLADAILFLLAMDDVKYSSLVKDDICPIINIGSGKDISIEELVELISNIIGYKGTLENDISKPDGTIKKLLDVRKINNLGWKYSTELVDGLSMTYDSYINRGIS
jgi:GDP-L-fucose synthase